MEAKSAEVRFQDLLLPNLVVLSSEKVFHGRYWDPSPSFLEQSSGILGKV